MLRKTGDLLRLLAAYTWLNLRAQLEYRGAFISQVLAMFLNDGVWVAFWALFFSRFQVLKGWNVNDVLTVWAVTASGFGLAYGVLGNGLELARLIAQGQLDGWLLYPRPVLPHVLVSRMHVSAWGDVLFGYAVYLLFVRPDFGHLLLFVALSLCVSITFTGFSVISGSISFFVGNASIIADQWLNAMITFSTYPAVIFDGAVRIILYTLIPAGFVSYLPIEALHQFSLVPAALTLLGALAILGISLVVFSAGLRRYESGNLMEMRG